MKRVLTALLASSFLFVAGWVGAASNWPEKLLIGAPLPLADITAWYSDQVKQGAQMAVDEINSSGGINGTKLELVVEDGKCTPQGATTAAEKLISQDRVNVLLGAFCSSASYAVSKVAGRSKVPYIEQSSAAAVITDDGNPYTYRIVANDRAQTKLLSEMMKNKLKIKTVALVYENTDAGVGGANFLMRYFGNDIKVVADEKVDRSVVEFDPLALRLKGLKPDAVVILMTVTQAARVVRSLSTQSVNAQILNTIWWNPAFDGLVGAAGNGHVRMGYLPPAPENDRQKKFQENLKKTYGDKAVFSHNVAQGYDVIRVIADAYKRGGPTPEGFLKAIKDTNFGDGVMGPIKFDAKGQNEYANMVFIKNEGGTLKSVGLR